MATTHDTVIIISDGGVTGITVSDSSMRVFVKDYDVGHLDPEQLQDLPMDAAGDRYFFHTVATVDPRFVRECTEEALTGPVKRRG